LLPIWACREALCAEVRESRVLVVVGETGSGKSTQLPQFLLQVRTHTQRTHAHAAGGGGTAARAHV
jgi:HrpA-like RNA helicase